MHYRIPLFLAFRLSVRRFQMPLEGLSSVKTLATFRTIYATDPLLQNVTKIVCLLLLTFDIFNYKPLKTMLNYVRQFFKITVVLLTLYLWNKVGDPHFFAFLTHSLSECTKNWKKNLLTEKFSRERPKTTCSEGKV